MSIFQDFPTTSGAKWVKSEGRQNGFDLETNCPCRQNDCLTAVISSRYLRHFDASTADLMHPDPRTTSRFAVVYETQDPRIVQVGVPWEGIVFLGMFAQAINKKSDTRS